MEEENRKAGEEEKTVGEADNSTKESRTLEEEEETRVAFVEPVDPVNSMEEGSTDLSDSQIRNSKDIAVAESETKEEEEKMVKFSNYTGSLMPEEVAGENNFASLNESEGIIRFPEDTAQTKEVNHMLDDNNDEDAGSVVTIMASQGILEGTKSSSASIEDSGDSSSDSDLDSRYIVDGSLPVSADVEETEQPQDEIPESRNENQMPLFPPKQRMLQPTSWKNCCGLLEFLQSSDQ